MDAPQIDDDERLLSYAEHLLKLIRDKNSKALYNEFLPKLEDYSIAYPDFREDDSVVFPAFLEKEFFQGGPLADYKRKEIGLNKYCDGRVWEIFIKPNQELFKTAGLS